ncbi:transposase family protein [Cardinium endosymbiont of Culicoides punctatus]|uniref:transposase family protein n=1 Tax=Cardinium endosymbiont of Culicoides punctatus TaxID=2304601 RepID=UPI001058B92F|nr:hypothetical protein CCPUN_07070 [Cardinium endosymbiont of Culicoides punctatus]
MKYEHIHQLNAEKFHSLTGVDYESFTKMVTKLVDADNQKKAQGGRKNKLRIEDQLLMTFEYLREYRTYLSMSKTYGISESAAYKAIKWVKSVFDKEPNLKLPERKI